jgi:uncharacterized membrane protein
LDEALAIGAIGFFLIGPWVLVWLGRRRRLREREEDRARWGDLTNRIYLLEHAVEEFKKNSSTPALPSISSDAVVAAGPTSSPEVKIVTIDEPAISFQPTIAEHTSETAQSTPPPPLPQIPVPESTPATPPLTLVDRFKSLLNLEEKLGTDWLNKLGIISVVVGLAFLLSQELKTLGPAGKVLLGFVSSAVILGAGIWAERSRRYRILARAGIGGGWALLFFTTYAMYHVPAARVLSSQTLDLVLLLFVAAVMVWHTLRYNSQVVTGLAFLLGFLTVSISHSDVYSLGAGGVLAAALVLIVLRKQWFELEILGILASYFNHYLWLRPIIEPMQGNRKPFPEFAASAALLLVYWLIFRVSYILRQTKDRRQEMVSTASALLNTLLLLLLFKYQSTHPEWAFWALLAIGAVETGLSQLPITKRRRSAVIVLSTMGVALLIAAFPFRYSGTSLSVLWLFEAEALLLIGVWTREIVFRRLGVLASLLAAGQLLTYDTAQTMGKRMDGADVHRNFPIAMMFAVASAIFYANAHWLCRRWRDQFAAEVDQTVMRRMSYVAALMAFVGGWIAFPEAWTAVVWAVLGLALAYVGLRFRIPDLGYQANFIAIASIARVFSINLAFNGQYHGVSSRLITIALVAALFYVSSKWSWSGESDRKVELGKYSLVMQDWVGGLYTWAASFLVALLAWYELRPVGVADAWAAGGLLLFEIGLSRKSLSLRLQAYVAFLAAFLRIFYVNLNAAGQPGEVSPRFYSIVPLALAFFYTYWRLEGSQDDLISSERRFKAATFCCYLGTISLVSLVRFEIAADWVAAAWAALVLALFTIAWRSGRRIFLHQALFGTLAVLFRTGLHNFYQRSYFPAPAWESRWITSGAVIVLLIAALPITFRLRVKENSSVKSGLVRFVQTIMRRPEQVVFFVAVGLLTALLALEMRHGMVTLSWGIEGVAVFLLALWLHERSFRLTGLALLLLCVGKILLVDVWRLNPSDRYITLIVLGGALLLVSFLYTRNSEKLRQYL